MRRSTSACRVLEPGWNRERKVGRVTQMLEKVVLISVFACCLPRSASARSEYELRSPDNRIEVRIHTADRIQYDVLLNGKALLRDSSLSIDIDHKTLGIEPKVLTTKERSVDQVIEPTIRQKFAKIRENYKELRLDLDGSYAVVFRAHDEGVAYRLETSLPQSQAKVYEEEASFNFADDYNVFYPQEDSFFSHNERRYIPQRLKAITAASLATLPAVVDFGDGVKVAIAESDVEDYPGLWLRGIGGNGLAAAFPPYPLQENAREGPRFQSNGKRRLHRRHGWYSNFSLAPAGHR